MERSWAKRVFFLLPLLQWTFNLVIWILDWTSRIEYALEMLGRLGVVVSYAMSPLVGIALVALGILYLIFVPAEDHPAVKSPVVGRRVARVLEWIMIGAGVLILGGMIVAGYIATQMIAYPEAPPCHIANEAALTEDLQKVGKSSVTILFDMTSRTAIDCVKEMQRAFIAAGWEAKEVPAYDVPEGITIAPERSDKFAQAVQSLRQILQLHGIKTKDNDRLFNVTLSVGRKEQTISPK